MKHFSLKLNCRVYSYIRYQMTITVSQISDNITLTNYETRYRHELGCYLQPAKKFYFRNSCMYSTSFSTELILFGLRQPCR